MYYRWMSMTATIFVALMVVTGETAPPTKLNFSKGFADTTGLVLNGNAEVSQPNLCLTVGDVEGQAGSAFSAAALPVGKFRTSFQFSLAGGDGITLTLQGFGPTALGGGGGGLGYTTIASSVAVKFDRFNNELQGRDSLIGLYTNGEEPTGGPTEVFTFPPVRIDEGVVTVNMTYDGTELTVKMSDLNDRLTQKYTIDIPGVLGASTAFVGFTGSTGVLTGNQCIVSWTYTGQ